jgi:hypothetical protein
MDEEEAAFEFRERIRSRVGGLEEAGRRVGMHLNEESVQAGVTADGQPVVQASFVLGKLAFTTRVLDPAAEAVNDSARVIAADSTRDERERILREAQEGIGPLADLENEGDE